MKLSCWKRGLYSFQKLIQDISKGIIGLLWKISTEVQLTTYNLISSPADYKQAGLKVPFSLCLGFSW